MELDKAIEAQLAGEIVRAHRMVEFHFRSGVTRLWPGTFVLVDGNGRKWHPTMGLSRVTGIQQALQGTAPELRCELSGVDSDFVDKVRGKAEEYEGRLVRVLWQFYTDTGDPIDEPIVITWGIMRSLTFSAQSTPVGRRYVVTLNAEGPFEGRARARNSYLTDTDQKMRSPGDAICERIAGIEAREVLFPSF